MYYLPAIIQIWSSGSTCQEVGAAPVKVRPNAAFAVAAVCLAAGVVFLGVCYQPVVRVISNGLELL